MNPVGHVHLVVSGTWVGSSWATGPASHRVGGGGRGAGAGAGGGGRAENEVIGGPIQLGRFHHLGLNLVSLFIGQHSNAKLVHYA